jgi:hypothetical protein
VFKRVTTLALPILCDFVDADLVVPTRDGEEVGGRREGEVGNAVGRRLVEGDVRLEIASRLRRRRAARRSAKETRHGWRQLCMR